MCDVRVATSEDFQDIYFSNNKTNPKENSAWFPPSIREDIQAKRVLFDPLTKGFLNFYPSTRGITRVTIYNVFVPRDHRGEGSGFRMISKLRELYPDRPIFAKCPSEIPANLFYEKTGWELREVIPPAGTRKAHLNFWVWEPVHAISGD